MGSTSPGTTIKSPRERPTRQPGAKSWKRRRWRRGDLAARPAAPALPSPRPRRRRRAGPASSCGESARRAACSLPILDRNRERRGSRLYTRCSGRAMSRSSSWPCHRHAVERPSPPSTMRRRLASQTPSTAASPPSSRSSSRLLLSPSLFHPLSIYGFIYQTNGYHRLRLHYPRAPAAGHYSLSLSVSLLLGGACTMGGHITSSN